MTPEERSAEGRRVAAARWAKKAKTIRRIEQGWRGGGEKRGMLPPPVCTASIQFWPSRKILVRKRVSERNCFAMPILTLSTGNRLLSERVQRAEYYPRDSLRSDALFNSLLSEYDAALETHEEDFLYIRTINGAAHIRGNGATKDATVLEQAGVYVYRRPKATASGTS
jgi:hypothetical protein